MQLDDLKSAWEKEIKMKSNMTEYEDIRCRAEHFDRRADVGWAIELLACAGVIIVVLLAWLVWLPTEELHLMFHAGMFAMVVSPAFVAAKIIWARKVSTADDWTLSAKLNIQIEKRVKEAKLLSTVAYWYLTPLLIAVALSSYGGYVQRTGTYIPDMGTWIYWAVCLVLYIGTYFLCQHQVKTKIRPMVDQLHALKRELES